MAKIEEIRVWKDERWKVSLGETSVELSWRLVFALFFLKFIDCYIFFFSLGWCWAPFFFAPSLHSTLHHTHSQLRAVYLSFAFKVQFSSFPSPFFGLLLPFSLTILTSWRLFFLLFTTMKRNEVFHKSTSWIPDIIFNPIDQSIVNFLKRMLACRPASQPAHSSIKTHCSSHPSILTYTSLFFFSVEPVNMTWIFTTIQSVTVSIKKKFFT